MAWRSNLSELFRTVLGDDKELPVVGGGTEGVRRKLNASGERICMASHAV
jgi:hypothetical protein